VGSELGKQLGKASDGKAQNQHDKVWLVLASNGIRDEDGLVVCCMEDYFTRLIGRYNRRTCLRKSWC